MVQSRRILAVSKSNLGPMPPALAYQLTTTGDVARVKWLGKTKHTASSLLSTQEPTGTTRDEAVEWLLEELAEGPKDAKYMEWLAKDAGFSKRTMERAKKAAGVASRHEGFGSGSRWVWAIDRHTPPATEVAAYDDLASFDDLFD